MRGQRSTKINSLLQAWPAGVVKTTAQLSELGVDRKLAASYVRQGWLRSMGHGAYARGQDEVSWRGGLHAIQTEGMAVHAGGYTALELLGYGHYVSNLERPVFLFGPSGKHLPAWFKKWDWGPAIVFSRTSILPMDMEPSFTHYDNEYFKIRISSPERAVLEMLYLVPDKFGFGEAQHILGSLTTLRPNLLQSLLEQCVNIKTKRLFLYMAKQEGHRWLSSVSFDSVDLGVGNREVIKGGRLDKEFKITVPKNEYNRSNY